MAGIRLKKVTARKSWNGLEYLNWNGGEGRGVNGMRSGIGLLFLLMETGMGLEWMTWNMAW